MTNDKNNSTELCSKSLDKLNKFFVLACYCIHFSDTPADYAKMYHNVCRANMADDESDADITSGAQAAIELIDPDWTLKRAGRLKPDSEKDRRALKQLRSDLRKLDKLKKESDFLRIRQYTDRMSELTNQIQTIEERCK